MRFQVQFLYFGKWEYQDSANTQRMAELLAEGFAKAWSNFGMKVRVLDTDVQQVVYTVKGN